MAAFGEGYRYHVTGLVHDTKGFPTSIRHEVVEATDRLLAAEVGAREHDRVERLLAGEHLGGKCFVDLDALEVSHLHAGPLEGDGGGEEILSGEQQAYRSEIFYELKCEVVNDIDDVGAGVSPKQAIKTKLNEILEDVKKLPKVIGEFFGNSDNQESQ